MMKLVLLSVVVAAALADVSHLASNSPKYIRSPSGRIPPWRILRIENDINPDGSYHYAYDTENGISVNEQGALKYIAPDVGISAQGGYRYTSPEGVPVQIQYVADENGYQPVGSVLPTPPPTPEAILRSLRFNAIQEGRAV